MSKVQHFLGRCEKALLVAIFSVMVALAFAQVILRTFFSTGLLWADVFLRHLVLWIGFLGAATAALENKHFAIEPVKQFLPERARRAFELATHLFAAGVLFLLSRAAIHFYLDERASGSVLFSIAERAVPAHWITVIIPAGFILLFIHYALNALEAGASLLRKEPR